MTNPHFCSECGEIHKLQPAHKEAITKILLDGLQAAAKSIIARSKNDFDLHELFGQYNIYNNFQKLRYFGLVHHVTDKFTKAKVRGHWLITRNGWAFLRGELLVHKWVKVRDNHIIEHSPDLIGVRDVYRGSDILTTTFEYFDENGQPMGVKPKSKPMPKQGSLWATAPAGTARKRVDE